jgi:hypothetical protein
VRPRFFGAEFSLQALGAVCRENEPDENANTGIASSAGGAGGGGGAQAPPALGDEDPDEQPTSSSGANFYVTSSGTAIPAIGYRAIGGPAVDWAQNGNLMSPSGTTYITFDDLSELTGEEAKQLLQLARVPTMYATFDTLQLVGNLTILGGNWNTSPIPEPITNTNPLLGTGGGTQAITGTSIQNYTLSPFR